MRDDVSWKTELPIELTSDSVGTAAAAEVTLQMKLPLGLLIRVAQEDGVSAEDDFMCQIPESVVGAAVLLNLMRCTYVPPRLFMSAFAKSYAAAADERMTGTFESAPLVDAFRECLRHCGADLASEVL